MLLKQKPVTFKNLVSFSITMSQLSELFVSQFTRVPDYRPTYWLAAAYSDFKSK